jgi:GntR family transcriptional regulator/MocR family aminotransferase
VRCDVDQILVVNGSQQALDLIVRVLVDRGHAVAVEDPLYPGARDVLRAAGARIEPAPVDRDGLDPALLAGGARLAFVTPSHQFPTGAILPLARRLALLDWAERNEAIIVEDDYDGEFRYDGQPLESLQGLDRSGRVIYVGTFSRTIFPGLRIGYLVAPKGLVAAFAAAKWLTDRHTAMLEQETLADFIASGLYERHLRRVRGRNAARRRALLAAMAEHLPNLEITGDGAGAHIAVWLGAGASEAEAIRRAAARGVAIYGVSRFFIGEPRPGFLLGYAQLTVEEIDEGIRRLGDAL